MKEEIIVSGRLNPNIDPQLSVWGWEIAIYLFLGGLAAGLLIFASLYFLRGKENEHKTAVRFAPMLAPFLIMLGLFALFLDLRHKLFFWQLYTTIRLQSPMSWGAWTLLIIMPISIAWSAIQLKSVFPKINLTKLEFLKLVFKSVDNNEIVNWEWKYKWLVSLEKFCLKYIKVLAWLNLYYGLILGVYTGILLSAFNARPLWNTSILGPLFLTSGLSTAAATIMLLTKDVKERKYFSYVDLVMIGIELFLITHLFMGFLASTQVQIDAAHLFLGGPYTLVFWIFVVFMGLMLPAFLEILEMFGFHIHSAIPAVLVLMGGIILRFVIVYAGQASRYLY